VTRHRCTTTFHRRKPWGPAGPRVEDPLPPGKLWGANVEVTSPDVKGCAVLSGGTLRVCLQRNDKHRPGDERFGAKKPIVSSSKPMRPAMLGASQVSPPPPRSSGPSAVVGEECDPLGRSGRKKKTVEGRNDCSRRYRVRRSAVAAN